QVCFQNKCIQDPNAGGGCIPNLWTGVGTWDDLNTYKNLLSLQSSPTATATAIPATTGGGGSEAPYQPSHCIANPSLCAADTVKNCAATSATTVGCPGFRKDAIRIYVQITDANQQCSGATCTSYTGASAGAALKTAGIKFVELYGTDDNTGTGTQVGLA